MRLAGAGSRECKQQRRVRGQRPSTTPKPQQIHSQQPCVAGARVRCPRGCKLTPGAWVARAGPRTRACLSLSVSSRRSCVSLVSRLAASFMEALVLVSDAECSSLRSGGTSRPSNEDDDERRISGKALTSPNVGGGLSVLFMTARQAAPSQRRAECRAPEQRARRTKRRSWAYKRANSTAPALSAAALLSGPRAGRAERLPRRVGLLKLTHGFENLTTPPRTTSPRCRCACQSECCRPGRQQ